MKHIVVIVIMTMSTSLLAQTSFSQDHSPVRLSESYELANIVLAMTPYGKSDLWEVSQKSSYYAEVRKHFDAFSHHPLLQTVNYSREKWESYLSFRTDAYAFEFDSTGVLKRSFSFYANNGFQPFDENLKLINDFVRDTGFREFYKQHRSYYQQLAHDYLASQHYDIMHAFLSREFPGVQTQSSYAIALSPLVGRMNCHRVVNGVNTDFITVPQFLLDGSKREVTQAEIVSSIHMLFTELDHGFVNPVTEKYQSLVNDNFSVPRWNNNSGYEEDSLAVFNEYMTWAVYDLFVHDKFRDVAEEVSRDWSLQNETRGFIASSRFNKELLKVYDERKPGQTIADLYPGLLKKLKKIQRHLRQPLIASCNLHNQIVDTTEVDLQIQFSAPMEKLSTFDIALATQRDNKTIVKRIGIPATQIRWSHHNTKLHFRLTLEKATTNFIRFNAPWTTQTVLRNKRGIDLPPYSAIKITVRE